MKFLLIIGGCGLIGIVHAAELPRSDNPVDFNRQVKEYITDISKNGVSVDRGKPEIRHVIKRDAGDWEASLAEIIGNPQQYDLGSSLVAISAANLRKKGRDPRISAAMIGFFHHTVQISTERLDQASDNPRVIAGTKGGVASLIARMLDAESPDVLQAILAFLHSPEVDPLETLRMDAPKDLASALQNYGDLRHVNEAEKVAKKLESIGRTDIASDIRRAADRIRKDAAQKQASLPDSTIGQSKDGTRTNDPADRSDGRPLWPWLAAGAALIAALVAYFRLKRAGT